MAKSKSKSPPKSKAPSAAAAADGTDVLARIANALERLAPQRAAVPDFAGADAFVWHPDGRRLAPVKRVNRVEMSLLKGIDRVRDVLVENTERFAKGLPANNALLWGARGMGKSSLVKAAHAGVNATLPSDMTPDTVTLEQAVGLLEARIAKGGGKGKAGKKAKAAAPAEGAPKARRAAGRKPASGKVGSTPAPKLQKAAAAKSKSAHKAKAAE
jgi:hypothetical protein